MIEIVAYILLAHVSKPDFAVNDSAVSKLVHWLSKQRNALGGFASTQVTIGGKLWGKKRYTVHRVICVSFVCMSFQIYPLQRGIHEPCLGRGMPWESFFVFCGFLFFWWCNWGHPGLRSHACQHAEYIQKPVNLLACTLVVSEHKSGPLDVYFSLSCLI